jgi:hypothetical protein
MAAAQAAPLPPLLVGGPVVGGPPPPASVEPTPAFVQVIGMSALATQAQVEQLVGVAGDVKSLNCFWLEEAAEGTPGTLIAYVRCCSLLSTTHKHTVSLHKSIDTPLTAFVCCRPLCHQHRHAHALCLCLVRLCSTCVCARAYFCVGAAMTACSDGGGLIIHSRH